MKRYVEKNIYQSNIVERPKRIGIRIPVQLTIGDKKHDGFIINISAHGVKAYINTRDESMIDCKKNTAVMLEVKPAFGVIFTLQCKIKNIHIQENSEHGLIISFGMEVIDPPQIFKIVLQRIL